MTAGSTGRPRFDRRSLAVVAALVPVLLAAAGYLATRTPAEIGPAASAAPIVARTIGAPARPSPTPPPPQAPAARAVPPAMAPAARAVAPSSAEVPYRFFGRVVSQGAPAIVLFGRGRVVTLHGPGPVDDEYVAEAVFDDYLVLRHLPTSAGHFLRLERHPQAPAPPQDPEDAARD